MMNNCSSSTEIAGYRLENCFYNASGAKCMTEAELDDLNNSRAAAIICKSCTWDYRAGNPAPRYYEDTAGSINSMGLPNQGHAFYSDYAAKVTDKPYFVSVAGLSLEENLQILKVLNPNKRISAIELNLSCPNVPGKPQTGYDFERTEYVLEQVFEIIDLPIGVKLPPYFDIIHFEMMAKILNRFPLSFVTCINSIGNALFIDADSESVVIKPKGGFGGIGGDYVKPTALANVRQFSQRLENIDVIACGGVKNGTDAFEHILCGAAAVQIGTQLMREGIKCFDRIDEELKSIMQKKGYKALDDFRGKLKTL